MRVSDCSLLWKRVFSLFLSLKKRKERKKKLKGRNFFKSFFPFFLRFFSPSLSPRSPPQKKQFKLTFPRRPRPPQSSRTRGASRGCRRRGPWLHPRRRYCRRCRCRRRHHLLHLHFQHPRAKRRPLVPRRPAAEPRASSPTLRTSLPRAQTPGPGPRRRRRGRWSLGSAAAFFFSSPSFLISLSLSFKKINRRQSSRRLPWRRSGETRAFAWRRGRRSKREPRQRRGR